MCSDLGRGLGANWQKTGNYRSILTAFLNVAETTEPGSTAVLNAWMR